MHSSGIEEEREGGEGRRRGGGEGLEGLQVALGLDRQVGRWEGKRAGGGERCEQVGQAVLSLELGAWVGGGVRKRILSVGHGDMGCLTEAGSPGRHTSHSQVSSPLQRLPNVSSFFWEKAGVWS